MLCPKLREANSLYLSRSQQSAMQELKNQIRTHASKLDSMQQFACSFPVVALAFMNKEIVS